MALMNAQDLALFLAAASEPALPAPPAPIAPPALSPRCEGRGDHSRCADFGACRVAYTGLAFPVEED